jgi:hypothetical protein
MPQRLPLQPILLLPLYLHQLRPLPLKPPLLEHRLRPQMLPQQSRQLLHQPWSQRPPL